MLLVLCVVTLGVYGYVWCWRVSKEVDAYLQRRHAHPLTKIGILLVVCGVLLEGVGFVVLFGSAVARSGGGFASGVLLLLVSIGLAGAGAVCMYVAGWRVWSTIHDREAAAGAPRPLSPGWQLALVLVPYVNVVGVFVAVYRTQNHLNAIWQGRVLP